MNAHVKIRLLTPHIHARVEYQAQAVVDVPASTAQYMIAAGIGVPEKPVKSKEK